MKLNIKNILSVFVIMAVLLQGGYALNCSHSAATPWTIDGDVICSVNTSFPQSVVIASNGSLTVQSGVAITFNSSSAISTLTVNGSLFMSNSILNSTNEDNGFRIIVNKNAVLRINQSTYLDHLGDSFLIKTNDTVINGMTINNCSDAECIYVDGNSGKLSGVQISNVIVDDARGAILQIRDTERSSFENIYGKSNGYTTTSYNSNYLLGMHDDIEWLYFNNITLALKEKNTPNVGNSFGITKSDPNGAIPYGVGEFSNNLFEDVVLLNASRGAVFVGFGPNTTNPYSYKNRNNTIDNIIVDFNNGEEVTWVFSATALNGFALPDNHLIIKNPIIRNFNCTNNCDNYYKIGASNSVPPWTMPNGGMRVYNASFENLFNASPYNMTDFIGSRGVHGLYYWNFRPTIINGTTDTAIENATISMYADGIFIGNSTTDSNGKVPFSDNSLILTYNYSDPVAPIDWTTQQVSALIYYENELVGIFDETEINHENYNTTFVTQEECIPPASGTWTITNDTVCGHLDIDIQGDIIIQSTAKLYMYDTTFTMNNSDGTKTITVYGDLSMESSTITSEISSPASWTLIQKGGVIDSIDSNILDVISFRLNGSNDIQNIHFTSTSDTNGALTILDSDDSYYANLNFSDINGSSIEIVDASGVEIYYPEFSGDIDYAVETSNAGTSNIVYYANIHDIINSGMKVGTGSSTKPIEFRGLVFDDSQSNVFSSNFDANYTWYYTPLLNGTTGPLPNAQITLEYDVEDDIVITSDGDGDIARDTTSLISPIESTFSAGVTIKEYIYTIEFAGEEIDTGLKYINYSNYDEYFEFNVSFAQEVNCNPVSAGQTWTINSKVVCQFRTIDWGLNMAHIDINSGGSLTLNYTTITVSDSGDDTLFDMQGSEGNLTIINSVINHTSTASSGSYVRLYGYNADTIKIINSTFTRLYLYASSTKTLIIDGLYAPYVYQIYPSSIETELVMNDITVNGGIYAYAFSIYVTDVPEVTLSNIYVDCTGTSPNCGGIRAYALFNTIAENLTYISDNPVAANTMMSFNGYGDATNTTLRNIHIEAPSPILNLGGYATNNYTIENVTLVDNNITAAGSCAIRAEAVSADSLTTIDGVTMVNCRSTNTDYPNAGFTEDPEGDFKFIIYDLDTTNSDDDLYKISVGGTTNRNVTWAWHFTPLIKDTEGNLVEGATITVDDGISQTVFTTGSDGYPNESEDNLLESMRVVNGVLSKNTYDVTVTYNGQTLNETTGLLINHSNWNLEYNVSVDYTPPEEHYNAGDIAEASISATGGFLAGFSELSFNIGQVFAIGFMVLIVVGIVGFFGMVLNKLGKGINWKSFNMK